MLPRRPALFASPRRCAALAGLLALAGCFQLREPEPATTASEWVPPTQVDILLSNFTTAVQHLSVGNFGRCFGTPGYRFVPDATTVGSSPTLFANWGITEETAWLNSLRRRVPGPTTQPFTLSNRRDNLFSADSAEISARYEWRLTQPDTAFRPTRLQGNLRFVLRRRSNEWRIVQWTDQRTGPEPCWTDAKKYFFTR